jgi:hypothetical protein
MHAPGLGYMLTIPCAFSLFASALLYGLLQSFILHDTKSAALWTRTMLPRWSRASTYDGAERFLLMRLSCSLVRLSVVYTVMLQIVVRRLTSNLGNLGGEGSQTIKTFGNNTRNRMIDCYNLSLPLRLFLRGPSGPFLQLPC